MLGDIAAGPAFRFTQWLQLLRQRTSSSASASASHHRLPSTIPPSSSPGEYIEDARGDEFPKRTEVSLWERLGKAEMLDIESSSFSWDRLSSLHHTEHSSINEPSEDEVNKALELTINSGGVVFFGFFNGLGSDNDFPKEAAAVIKITSSRMATQSERLGYEFAKWLGVGTPQARVIHNTSLEWLQIKEATEKARDASCSKGDEIGEMTCLDLLEALELSRCVFFMSYVHGSPLLESSCAFESPEYAERTSASLGRVMMLDLVIRNEDRLPCRQLRWRGNSANLLLAENLISANTDTIGETFDSTSNQDRPRLISAHQNERRSTSADIKLSSHNPALMSQRSDVSEITESLISTDMSLKSSTSGESSHAYFDIVAIDSGVPRRPPTGKLANDQVTYPKLVELLLNSSEFSSNLLHDITGGRLGCPPPEEMNTSTGVHASDVTSVVHKFRCSFRAALRDLQGFHIFLLTLHQKLDNLLQSFMNTMNKISSMDSEKEDLVVSDTASPAAAGSSPSSTSKERFSLDNHQDLSDSESHKTTPRTSLISGGRNCCDSTYASREGSHGKFPRGSGESLRSLRLATKLRDFHKFAKVDTESNKELEQWNEMLKNDVIKLCQENNFNTGFFEGSDNNCVVDAYELKVRLEHILERIVLISEAANIERPSAVTDSLFVGGALAAKSLYTLQHLGITHILCLCTNEIGQSVLSFLIYLHTKISIFVTMKIPTLAAYLKKLVIL